jgi:choline dehydrogenase
MAHRRLAEESAVFPIELARAFVADFEGGACCVHSIQHPFSGHIQSQLFLELQRAHRGQRTELTVQGRDAFVQPAPDPHPIAHAFLQGAAAHGIATFDDQNGVLLEGDGGAAITNVRIRDGRRRNIPADYLYPVMHQPNLTVLTGAHVRRITFEDATATGVEFEYQGEKRKIRASTEVILSAGAINTTGVLMHSGIGDRSELGRFGISTVSYRPGVGQNLQDHPIIGSAMWEGHEPIAGRNNSAEANFLTKSSLDLSTPDLHCWHIEGPYASEVTGKLAVPATWSISPGLVRPESRGFLRLQSADPRKALAIHANMLSDML